MNTPRDDNSAHPVTARAVVYKTLETAPFVEGRREFFKYRDLGLVDATGGLASATVTLADKGIRPTGWHYHVCAVQFIYMMSGWIDLEFEDGTKTHLKAGDSIYIPSGLRHNETAASQEFELVEVQVPANMKTIPCDPPEGFQ